MSTTYTEHYNFGKQENYADLFSMKVITDNWDSLDAILYAFSTGKQDKIDTSHKLDPTLVDFSAAQQAALDSGVTAEDVEQIDLNKSNILSVADQSTQYNLLSYTLAALKSYNSSGTSWNGNVCTKGNLNFTVNDDMTITVSGSQGTGSAYFVLAQNVSFPAIRFQGCPAGGGSSTYQLQAYYSSAPTSSANDNGTGISVEADTWSEICITIRANQTFSNPITFKPMAIPQSLYDAGFTDYQPYSLPNTVITPALQECVENSKANYINMPDKTMTEAGYVYNWTAFDVPQGNYVISLKSNVAGVAAAIELADTNASSYVQKGYRTLNPLVVGVNHAEMSVADGAHYVRLYANGAVALSDIMLIPAQLYNAGITTYQPYAKRNVELTADVASLTAKSQKTISSSGNTSKLRLTLNTSVMSNTNRGSLILSIPFQTSSYDNALLLIAIGNDSFLGVQRLDNSNNSMVTSWALSANNTILDITLRAQPWSAPVAFPLAQVAPPITYSWES